LKTRPSAYLGMLNIRAYRSEYFFAKRYMTVSIITNSCTHSKIFIKNTLKAHVKFTPTCFGTQREPSSGGQHLILTKVYIWFNGASQYSQYCGGIRKLQWKTYLLQQQVKSYMCFKWYAKCQTDLPYVCVYC